MQMKDIGMYMGRFLRHEKLYVRFLSLLALGLILFLIAWIISYSFLPEGIMRGKNAAAGLAGDEAAGTVTAEFARIALVNLIMGSLILSANMVLKINGYPLGYIIPLIWLINYGMVLGSNSFTVPMPYRMGLSFEVLRRSGLYELGAYSLFAASTYGIARYEIKKLFVTNPEKIQSKEIAKMDGERWIGTILAVLVLICANLWEAYMIVNR